MKTNSEYKDLAVEALSGNWGKGALATLIYLLVFGALPSVVTIPFMSSQSAYAAANGSSGIVTIVLLPLVFGFEVFFLSIFRRENPSYGSLFDGFNQYGRTLGTSLLMGVYIVLWCLLLIIPGIKKAYSYSMTYYVMKDNPDLKYNAAIEESMRLMKGHKRQLFVLDLSMIGWAILSCLTAGIGWLFLAPYNQTAHAAFYEDLKAEQADGIAWN